MASSQSLTIVALRTVRYSDRHAILRAYSRQLGPVSLLLPAGSGREAARRRALLMPLSIAECKADIRPVRDIHPFTDLVPSPLSAGLHSHPVKASIALFVAEVLGALLREGQPDETLFDFLAASVKCLSKAPAERLLNFHLAFMRQLSRYVGIEPDFGSVATGTYFDMRDGVFRAAVPLHPDWCDANASLAVKRLGRMDYANMHRFRLSRAERNDLLDGILRYYSLHLARLDSLQTLPVLRSL